MGYKPDIALVYPHPKGYRGDDDLDLVIYKSSIRFVFLFRVQSGVVSFGGDIFGWEKLRQTLRLLVGKGVDDAAFVFEFWDKLQ